MRWQPAALRGFLSNRILLYELCELCANFPGAGTPTQYTGLNRVFSDWICAEIDKGLSLYRNWYTSRAHEMEKRGKHSYRPKYRTLDELLGITEALRRGGFATGAEITSVSDEYRQAVIAAHKRGEAPPDVTEWLARYHAGDFDQ